MRQIRRDRKSINGRLGLEFGGNECRFSFEGNENVLKFIVVIDVQLCEYTKNNLIVFFKWVNYM